MTFEDYQIEAKKTIQCYDSDGRINNVVPFLGIIGEVGSVVSELKKSLRDGKGYSNFSNKLKEELGDVLWYVSAIASQQELSLGDIAAFNLDKTADRFGELDSADLKKYDERFPQKERFPDKFEIEFKSFEKDGKRKVKIFLCENGKQLGDDLTDNSHDEDGYRFHDIFHFGYVAYLGWSPVVRSFLGRKRKSKAPIDENEDGARAQITEELISLFIYNHALEHELLRYSKSIDTNILKTVQQLVSKIEVYDCSAKQWEVAILNSYKVFNKLRENEGGRVLVNTMERNLEFLG